MAWDSGFIGFLGPIKKRRSPGYCLGFLGLLKKRQGIVYMQFIQSYKKD